MSTQKHSNNFSPLTFVYIINVDWYFDLHWLQRALATQKTGFVVHLIMDFTDDTLLLHLRELGFICHTWTVDRKSINPFNNFKAAYQLYGHLRSIGPDIVHAITIKPNIYTGLIAYLFNFPFVLSITGTGTVFSGQSVVIKLIKPFIRLIYKALKSGQNRRRIIFENSEDLHYFVNTKLCAADEAVLILGAGVNTEIYKAVAEPLTDKTIILFAARLLWDKGLGDLVEATKLLRAQGLSVEVQVAGIMDHATMSAIPESVLEQWHSEGLINWLGTVKNMPDLIAQANIVVLPTFYGEGVPRILIEASASQRAIVTTDMPGCRELVKQGVNGLLVPPQNVAELANALSQLINDPALREKMGKQGRNIVEQSYAEQQVITQTLSIYTELLH